MNSALATVSETRLAQKRLLSSGSMIQRIWTTTLFFWAKVKAKVPRHCVDLQNDAPPFENGERADPFLSRKLPKICAPFDQATEKENNAQWNVAVKSEMDLISRNQTWFLMLRSKASIILSKKRVSRKKGALSKEGNRTVTFKARLVTDGS